MIIIQPKLIENFHEKFIITTKTYVMIFIFEDGTFFSSKMYVPKCIYYYEIKYLMQYFL